MRPLYLTIQAFGSYSDRTRIDFTKPEQNIFLIRGDTGAGKTTIFDAIVFALYGEASSTANRKDGAELQSQFADPSLEPYAELTFTEKTGEETQEYTVRRVPKHVRPVRRRGKNQFKDVSESVSLVMPDGLEFAGSARETDEKIAEIVGLTKDQFMQVAMIAQGEFMELLRAKSDVKKVIFRKLFGTQLYSRVVDELQERRRKMEAQIVRVRVACQTEIAHTAVPEEYENAEEMKRLQKQMQTSERGFAADLENFMEELDRMLAYLGAAGLEAEQKSLETAAARDAARDAYKSAQMLAGLYGQLDRAKEELAALSAEEESIKAAELLYTEIGAAYEIKAEHGRLTDALAREQGAAADLKKNRESVPSLKKTVEAAAGREKEEREALDTANELLTGVQERVGRAMETFARLREVRAAAENSKMAKEKASGEAESAETSLKELERKVLQWKAESENLRDLGERLLLFDGRKKEEERIAADLDKSAAEEEEIQEKEQELELLQEEYMKTEALYTQARKKHDEAEDVYLAAQAGVLAQSLEEGKPCPVCGSLHHPAPCRGTEGAEILTKEELDALAAEEDKLRESREKKARDARIAQELISQRKKIFQENKEHLEADLERIGMPFVQWRGELEKEGIQLEKDQTRSRKIQTLLIEAEEESKRLQAAAEEARRKLAEAGEAFAGSSAALQQLQGSLDFPSEEEAKAALTAAKKQKEERETAWKKAEKEAGDARAALEGTNALIGRLEKELPGLQEDLEQRRRIYEEQMEQKGLSAERWKEVTGAHQKGEQKILRERIENHRTRTAAAKRAAEEAVGGIAGKERPVTEDLKAAMEKEEKRAKEAREASDRLGEILRTDRNVYERLSAGKEERSALTQRFSRIDWLYSRLAGKVSGSRMDIETYVQRYWLERILEAANLRFREMSAGQFSLHMCGEESAGAGRNRGLDLMVYSNVTGREREIRTLSGGESFMAALSLALGMADQIRAGSACVNLDIMFIDEGFGSLDSASREQAVKVLKQMAGSERMIGIISHVTELSQEIEDQLVVTRDDSGSHAEWQLS